MINSCLGMICLLPLCLQTAFGAEAIAKPRPKSVRIVYLVSADRSVREDFRKGIETAANDLQGWYGKQLGGPTFRLNDPVVEIAKSDKDAKWFYSNPNGDDKDDWGFNNGLSEARRVVGAKQDDPQYVWVIYSDGPGDKGQGGSGVAILPENDLLGLVGQHPVEKDVKRWIAGLGHELGHAFGLQHPRDTAKHADAIMWMGIYGKYPDHAYLTDEDKATLMRSPFFFRPDGEPVVEPAQGNHSAPAADGKNSLMELRKEKLAAANDWWNALSIAYSYSPIEPGDMYEASISKKIAAFEIAAGRKERIAALDNHQQEMEVQHNMIYALSVAKARGGEVDNRTATKYWLLEAKVWLLEENATP